LLIISAYLAWAGHKIVFGEKREKPHVIRKNVFGIVRHPLYISEILLYLALLLLKTSLAGLAVWIIIIAFLHYISRHEEKMLLARFGDKYKKYMRDVPMYFPRLRRGSTKPSK
jgi:protein-S-isoprenylcysteine O-methyltransferase Ste14